MTEPLKPAVIVERELLERLIRTAEAPSFIPEYEARAALSAPVSPERIEAATTVVTREIPITYDPWGNSEGWRLSRDYARAVLNAALGIKS